jgi:hypothetical protein
MKIDFTFPLYWQPETAALFMDFVQMRKAIRKPIATQRGFDALVRSVDKDSRNRSGTSQKDHRADLRSRMAGLLCFN